MKYIRLILIAVAFQTVLATAVVAWALGPAWTVVVAACGILATMLLATYALLKSIQVALQRLTGLIKKQARAMEQQDRIENALRNDSNGFDHEVQAQLSAEARTAIEDLRLASRSITVPQAHFDQLLRTISANTVRNEAALDDAVDVFRMELRALTQADISGRG